MEEEGKKHETHMTSAADFVEGGIQDSCDDSCSICLEDFCESDPSTVTNCKHEYHLQCILEWCQRSSECPMCLRPISLKDPASQELLEAVDRERKLRATPSRNATVFRHPTLGDFELQHLPVGVSDSDLEERIIQHLAAAAAMGRTHHFGRRGESHRHRQSSHNHPHFLVFSSHPSAHSGQISSSRVPGGRENEPSGISIASSSTPRDENSQQTLQFPSASRSSSVPMTRQRPNNNRINASHSSLPNQDQAESSELQSFSETLKSRLNAVSTRYKESISRSTRGWKERLFSRSSSIQDIGTEVRREVNAGIASVSRMMERLETRDDDPEADRVSLPNHSPDHLVNQRSHVDNFDSRRAGTLSGSNTPPIATSSTSN